MRNIITTICTLAIAILVLAPSASFAAPPPNDNFSSPTILSGFPTTASGTNVDATLGFNEPLPERFGFLATASVWFRWTPTASGPVQINTNGSNFDTILAVWTGSNSGNLIQVGNFTSDQSVVAFNATAGVTYQIAVYGSGYRSVSGLIALNISADTMISGRVTGPNGITPLENIGVTAYRWTGLYWDRQSSGDTNTSGNYTIRGLTGQTYRVEFSDGNGNFISEYYDNATNISSATDIVASAGATVTGINASLANASRISGRVVGPSSTTPLEFIRVTAYRWTGQEWDEQSSTFTADTGNYSIGSLPAGTYRIEFAGTQDYTGEFYNNAANLDSAVDIVVPAVTVVGGINASLANAPRISGRVTGPSNTTPLEDIRVTAYHWTGEEWDWQSSTSTAADGNYTIKGLSAGTYRIEFNGTEDYAGEFYNNAANLDSALDIVLPAASNVGGINASLANASRISGRVTGPSNTTPLEGIGVTAYRWTGQEWDWQSRTSTAADGNYTIKGLRTGTYRIKFEGNNDYASEYYDNAVDLDSALDIVVPAEATVSGINASLANASQISGRLTKTDGTTPLANIFVRAYLRTGQSWSSEWSNSTDSNGNYSIKGLPAGTYRIQFGDDYNENRDYLSEYYNNTADLGSALDIVVPTETNITGIDASLVKASKISGRVTGPDGTAIFESIDVTTYRWTGTSWDRLFPGPLFTSTDANGNYSINGLTAGTYRIGFRSGSGNFASEYYNNTTTLDSATDIIVSAETTITGIDASLENTAEISGRITGPNGAMPLGNISVNAYHWTGQSWSGEWSTTTSSNGNYSIRGLRAGNYRLQFVDSTNENYVQEYYNDASDIDSAIDIVVPAEATVSGIDASLAIASRISGRVTGPGGATPLKSINVLTYRWTGSNWQQNWLSYAYTDANGNYSIGGLLAGTYRVRFKGNGNYLEEFYDDAPTLDSATDIILSAATTINGIDASLANGSRISGKVTGPSGTTPLKDIYVSPYRWTGSDWEYVYQSYAFTDNNGNYSIEGLIPGTYRLQFSSIGNGDHVSEYYSDSANLNSAADIIVTAGTTITGINASLAIASRISGRVTGPGGTTSLEDINVYAYRWTGSDWDYQSNANTDGNGNYSVGGLPAGTYRIEFQSWDNIYAGEYYNNAPTLDSATDIVVATQTTVTGIDASLANAARISGRVTGPNGTNVLKYISVSAYRWTGGQWDYQSSASTDDNGNYSVGGLSAGTYRIEFQSGSGEYAREYYNNALTLDAATDIIVSAETTITGIDATLISNPLNPPTQLPAQLPKNISFHHTGASAFQLRFTGSPGQTYFLQSSPSMHSWNDVSSFICQPGTNTIPLNMNGKSMFWRIRTN
jgi:5-hydroxyisourate hydrolase-like protein (transthyretin family)